MKALVLDASAAIAHLLDEPGADEVRRHLEAQARSGEPMLVPTWFWLEVVNVLAHRHRLTPGAIVEAVYELEQVGLVTAELGRPATLAVIDAIGRSGLTAYDAAYLVLAESSDARLLTADAALARAAGDRAVLVGPASGVREPSPTYRADSPWTAWEGAGAYLAELRAAILLPVDR